MTATMVAIFLIVYLGMVLLQIDRTGVALLGAIALVSFDAVSFQEAAESVAALVNDFAQVGFDLRQPAPLFAGTFVLSNLVSNVPAVMHRGRCGDCAAASTSTGTATRALACR
jgi:hypothetical protein